MKHLDERVSELVDNRLDHDERDQALAHLATCEQCRGSFEYERTAKAALSSLLDVEPSDKLTSALFGLAEPGGPLPPERSVTAKAAPVAGWREPSTQSPEQPANQTRRVAFPGRGTRLAAMGVFSAGGVVALLTAVGAPSEDAVVNTPVPGAVSIAPTGDEFLLEHAQTTVGFPFAEPASYLAPILPVQDVAEEKAQKEAK